jgi:NAD(P)H-hydrate repair Nnr-like enzyme with NAD(P)H-hydrate dehydratase domain
MEHSAAAGDILLQLLRSRPDLPLLLNAAMLRCAGQQQDALPSYSGPLVLTPHPVEMAAMLGVKDTAASFEKADEAARRFRATIVLKSIETDREPAGT